MIFLSFYIFVSKFKGWKGRHFYGRPRAALRLTTPLDRIHESRDSLSFHFFSVFWTVGPLQLSFVP